MKIITILDEVHCKANAEARKVVKYALSYKAEHWRQGQFAKEQEIKRQFLITGRKGTSGQFLTGLLPRVLRYCKRRKQIIKVIGKRELIKPTNAANLTGIEFREDQIRAIKQMTMHNRGKVIAPTGSGKTLVALGLVSKFPENKTIILAHTVDLITQFVDEAKRFYKNLPEVYAPTGSADLMKNIEEIRDITGALLITTIQSLSYIAPENYIDLFDITIIDECHHVNKEASQYGKFMQHNLSPRRYGFTATDLRKRQLLLVNEGLIGPRLSSLRVSKGIELGIIAKPKVGVINVPYDAKINKAAANRYARFYQLGIVENKKRNAEIIKEIVTCVSMNLPVLVLVEKLKHGEILQDILKRRQGLDVPFIQGKMQANQRKFLKQAIIEEDIHAAIATRVWMEGINIPNLRAIIYAAGMKEEKKALQAMGRGLRVTDNKDTIILIDFLDPYKYLAEHSIRRLQIYNKEKWL